MANKRPIETRTSRMAYCSRSPLPSSANSTKRFQSTSYPSIFWRFGFGHLFWPSVSASRLCGHPFDPLSAECGSGEWIRKVLCFARNLDAIEFHDAHGVGRLGVICEDEFGDPKITAADDSPDRKPLFVRLTLALALYVASTAG